MRNRSCLSPFVVVVLASLTSSSCGHRRDAAQPAAESATASAPGDVVAKIEGKPVTRAELDKYAAGGLERIRHDEYEVRLQALEQLIFDRALEKEAAARGLSKEAYLKSEVADKVPAPSEQEIATLYEANRARFGGRSFEEIKAGLTRSVRDRRQNEQEQILRHALRQQAQVEVLLEEPRAKVAIPPEALALGPESAPVTMVEFLDYQCPYCHKVQGVVDELLAAYPGKVRFIHREYLLGSPRAMPAARAARCAAEQNRFWEYHKGLLTEPGDMSDADLQRRASALSLDGATFSACLTSDRHDATIKRSVAQGNELGVSGTPTFFINGRRLVGVRPVGEFRQMIEAELRRKS
jgi:protein-disulfide isomerase